jgi:prevent-host-death family protein
MYILSGGSAMTTVTAKQLKEASAEVLSRVQYGHERVAITRHGKEVAAVVSIEDARLLERLEGMLDIHDALAAIEEAEREGTISLDELRGRLGL